MTDAAANRDGAGDASDRHEVLVVGGGQAGLAIGYFLAQQGRRFTILEAASGAGGGVAGALGLAEALHAGALRQPARPPIPR
jgi:ribulose 1,5-bisphosphate synthetase/thiazole synthase